MHTSHETSAYRGLSVRYRHLSVRYCTPFGFAANGRIRTIAI